jgi:hypothetical protein
MAENGFEGMDRQGTPNIPLGADGQMEPVAPLQFASPTLRALDVLGAEENMDLCRQELLEELIFRKLDMSRQPMSSYRRLLLTSSAHKILKVVWKESSFVSDSELTIMGIARNFSDGEITQHHLAVVLSEEPSDVSALNTKVRNVGIAAYAVGMIDRREQGPKKVLLSGTDLLHEFMLELASRQMQFIQAIGSRCGDPDSH